MSVNDVLRISFFVLMGVGLALASVFLHYDKIDGSQWTTICLGLFTADRFGNVVSEGVSAARYRAPVQPQSRIVQEEEYQSEGSKYVR